MAKEKKNGNKISQPETKVIMRSIINFAAYNPRKISDEARKKLKANLKRVGLLGGIVWNKRSGNLVSGHQRVGIMDEVNGYVQDTHANDYPIKVEVVDLDDKTEKEQNLFMNNRSVQGEFDDDMLRELIEDIDIDLAGFNDFDLEMLGIDDGSTSIGKNDEVWTMKGAVGKDQQLAMLAQKTQNGIEDKGVSSGRNFYEDSAENQIKRHNEIQKIKDRIGRQNDINNDNGALSYVVISFNSPIEKFNFMESFGYAPTESVIDGEDFNNRLEFGVDG